MTIVASITPADPGASLPRKRVLRRRLEGDPSQTYYLYVPESGGRGAPVLVSVHGISRNAREHAKLFSSYCERYGVVLIAPRFDVDNHPDYQRLGRAGRGERADLALNQIICEVGAMTGAFTGSVFLFGYSGGAQFAHRYAMAHPECVARAVLASAGWYTFPDTRRRFPYGIRPTRKLSDTRFDPEAFLRVPIDVLVGSNERETGNLCLSKRVNRQQGKTRNERAHRWVEAMQATAAAFHLKPLVTIEDLADSRHSFRRCMKRSGLGARVFTALFGPEPSEGEEVEARVALPRENGARNGSVIEP